MCFAVERRALFRHLNFQKWREHLVLLTFWLRNVLRAAMACTFSTSQLPRVVRVMVCFVHVDFEMCFAPQRRALFRHGNFQKWSEREVIFAFSLANVLCATTACTFSTSQFPKVVRACGVCTFWLGNVLRATPACNFVISHLARWLRTRRRFSEAYFFDPPEPQNHWKTQCFATFLSFRAPASSFFWLFLFCDLLSSALLSSTPLFSLTLPVSAFHLSILSEVWPLNFLRTCYNKKLLWFYWVSYLRKIIADWEATVHVNMAIFGLGKGSSLIIFAYPFSRGKPTQTL